MRKTYIYIVIHPKFEGWLKVGRSLNLLERLNTYQVCCPNREFSYGYTKELSLDKIRLVENYFKTNIHNNGYEWFECTLEKAITIIEELLIVPQIASK